MRKSFNPSVPALRQYAPGDGGVRVGPLMNLPVLLCDLDCDPKPIFADMGFNLAQFADPDFEIPFTSGSKLLARCVTATGCDHLGLLLGERAVASSLGLAGFMLRTAPDVGTALWGLVRHLDLHDRGAVATLTTNNRHAFFGYNIHLLGVEAVDQIYDIAITVACKIMRSLCGDNWNPTKVLLSRQPPQDLAPYQRFFRAPLRFDADQSALAFQARWLSHPLASADPLLHRHLEAEANELHSLQGINFIASFRLLLRLSLKTQKSRVKDIAKQLGIHERTLNRRLRREGTAFRLELETIRYEMAQQLLADGMMPLSTIATALNYSDPTAFSRAFKRWSGLKPTEWREARH